MNYLLDIWNNHICQNCSVSSSPHRRGHRSHNLAHLQFMWRYAMWRTTTTLARCFVLLLWVRWSGCSKSGTHKRYSYPLPSTLSDISHIQQKYTHKFMVNEMYSNWRGGDRDMRRDDGMGHMKSVLHRQCWVWGEIVGVWDWYWGWGVATSQSCYVSVHSRTSYRMKIFCNAMWCWGGGVEICTTPSDCWGLSTSYRNRRDEEIWYDQH